MSTWDRSVRILAITLALASPWSIHSFAEALEHAELDEDEAGLWMLMDRHEQDLRTSSRTIRDPALTAHLEELTCRTVGPACKDIRVYAVRAPGMNAFMMANGSMFVQSGLLLRVEDNSELAAVLAHEVAHFQRRHSIESMRRWHKTNARFAVLGSLIAAAGTVATVSSDSYEDAAQAQQISGSALLMLQTARVIAAFQLIAYDRNQEQEADIDSIEWMQQNDMDVNAAPRIWRKVIREQAAGGDHSGFSLLATHPTPEQRLVYLTEKSQTMSSSSQAGASNQILPTVSNETRDLVDPYREEWLLDELAVQHPGQFSVIAAAQVQMGLDHAFSLYLTAKSWIAYANKVRRSKRQRTHALQEAAAALEAGDTIAGGMEAAAYRDWGKISAELGDPQGAKVRFEQYLSKAPEAWDAEFIRREIGKL